ncbi:hypothetical protein HY571_01425 [Candidatus Micrarchaeota archaeon]|nr:hypothetical protein [Candidatus Micrarchaeota archaeon]
MNFVLLSALLPNARFEVRLQDPTSEQIATNLENFLHLVSSNIYYFSPIDYEKVIAFSPKNVSDLSILSTFTPTRIVEIVKPSVKPVLQEPGDESELKKFKEKQKALHEIAVCAFMHRIFSQVYPPSFPSTGNPQKREVRVASNIPNWQVVKKIDVEKVEPREIFASLANMYYSIHSKYPFFSGVNLKQLEIPRKSYSALLTALPQTEKTFAGEWSAFETLRAYGYPPVPSPEVIGRLYPELKVPKPRGNWHRQKR